MRKENLVFWATVSVLGVGGCADDVSPGASGSASSDGSSSSASDSGSTTDDPTAGEGSTSGATTGDTDDDTDGETEGDSTSTGADAVCGDGVVEGDEACDDGGESATCNDDCTSAMCGDGVLNETAGEVCDGAGRSDACNDDCTLATCGDGIVNAAAGETCDDGGESATCNIDCTAAMCGDGVLNATAGEACDDSGESASCNADCTTSSCGDGVVNMTAGETCDDENDIDTDACLSTCVDASCGDGFVQEGVEQCDDGGNEDMDGCSAICEAECGDGELWCGGCIDPNSDELHCGDCESPCGDGEACIDETCIATQVLVVGPNGVTAALQTAGYTVNAVTWSEAEANLDASVYPVAFVGRYATNWAQMTPGVIDALTAYSNAGGNIVTEWDGPSIFFSGYDATYRYPTGAPTPLGWYSGTVGAGYNLTSGTPISQEIVDPMFNNVDDPFSAGGATEFFFTFQDVDTSQLELMATFPGDGSANFPAGQLPTIYRGQRCGGNIIFASFDYQDGATQAGFGDLMGNFVEAALAPPSDATTDVCP